MNQPREAQMRTASTTLRQRRQNRRFNDAVRDVSPDIQQELRAMAARHVSR